MAETPESKVKKQIKALLAEYHVNTPATAGFGKSGQLDFVCCIFGSYVAIEAKSIYSGYGKNGPTQLQWDEIDSICRNGGYALVVDETTIDMLAKFLNHIRDRKYLFARETAHYTLGRFERPALAPNDVPQPTKRKRHV